MPIDGGGTPIAALTPYNTRWTLHARVTNKSAIRTWTNAKGEGKLFSMDLIDESGACICDDVLINADSI